MGDFFSDIFGGISDSWGNFWDNFSGNTQKRLYQQGMDQTAAGQALMIDYYNRALAEQVAAQKRQEQIQREMLDRALNEQRYGTDWAAKLQAAQMGMNVSGNLLQNQYGLDNAIKLATMQQAQSQPQRTAQLSALQALPTLQRLIGLTPYKIPTTLNEANYNTLGRDVVGDFFKTYSATKPLLSSMVQPPAPPRQPTIVDTPTPPPPQVNPNDLAPPKPGTTTPVNPQTGTKPGELIVPRVYTNQSMARSINGPEHGTFNGLTPMNPMYSPEQRAQIEQDMRANPFNYFNGTSASSPDWATSTASIGGSGQGGGWAPGTRPDNSGNWSLVGSGPGSNGMLQEIWQNAATGERKTNTFPHGGQATNWQAATGTYSPSNTIQSALQSAYGPNYASGFQTYGNKALPPEYARNYTSQADVDKAISAGILPAYSRFSNGKVVFRTTDRNTGDFYDQEVWPGNARIDLPGGGRDSSGKVAVDPTGMTPDKPYTPSTNGGYPPGPAELIPKLPNLSTTGDNTGPATTQVPMEVDQGLMAMTPEQLVQNSPIYKYQQKENEGAIRRMMAARGLLNSSHTLSATRKAQEALSANEADKQVLRLANMYNAAMGYKMDMPNPNAQVSGMQNMGNDMGSLSNIYNQAAQNRANTFSNFGNNMSNLYGQQGDTQRTFLTGMGNFYNQQGNQNAAFTFNQPQGIWGTMGGAAAKGLGEAFGGLFTNMFA